MQQVSRVAWCPHCKDETLQATAPDDDGAVKCFRCGREVAEVDPQELEPEEAW